MLIMDNNDDERIALAKKLDADLEAFIETKVSESADRRVKSCDGERSVADMSVDELVAELKQHPAFMTEFDASKPMSTATEALQSLKYDADNDEESATSYKEDGNKNFERKKYRWAIDNYTAGIKCKPTDRLLNAILYTNRAAANFHIGNFRSSFTDCILARKFKDDHMKAILRGAQCCIELRKYSDAIKWCDDGLVIKPTDSKLLELRTKADKLMRQEERDKRKELAKTKKESFEQMRLLAAVKERGIKLESTKKSKQLESGVDSLACLETGDVSRPLVSLDTEGVLHWPVLFLYPEFGETDFISSFSELSRFSDHIELMFGEFASRPGWDTAARYTPSTIEIYFEERDEEKLHRVQTSSTLLNVLKDKRYSVVAGTPSFILLVDQSPFALQFLAKYKYAAS